MILAVLFANSDGNILIERYFPLPSPSPRRRDLVPISLPDEIYRFGAPLTRISWAVETHRFHGVPAEERLHWRSFLVKLGSENLKGSKNEELHVASHKYVSKSPPTPPNLVTLPHHEQIGFRDVIVR
jgi:hypothetical protein